MDDKTSNDRLMKADAGGRLCCSERLRYPLSASRAGAAKDRATELLRTGVCPQLKDDKDGTSSKISGLCGGLYLRQIAYCLL